MYIVFIYVTLDGRQSPSSKSQFSYSWKSGIYFTAHNLDRSHFKCLKCMLTKAAELDCVALHNALDRAFSVICFVQDSALTVFTCLHTPCLGGKELSILMIPNIISLSRMFMGTI